MPVDVRLSARLVALTRPFGLSLQLRIREGVWSVFVHVFGLVVFGAGTAVAFRMTVSMLREHPISADAILSASVFGVLLVSDCLLLRRVLLVFTGHQEIDIDGSSLKLVTVVCGVRFRRTLATSSVRTVRIDERLYPRKKGAGLAIYRTIAFDLGGTSIRTRGNLSRIEAERIIELLAPYFASDGSGKAI